MWSLICARRSPSARATGAAGRGSAPGARRAARARARRWRRRDAGSSGSMLPSCSPAAIPMRYGPTIAAARPRRRDERGASPDASACAPSIASARDHEDLEAVWPSTNGRDQSKLVRSPARRRLDARAVPASSVPAVERRFRWRRSGRQQRDVRRAVALDAAAVMCQMPIGPSVVPQAARRTVAWASETTIGSKTRSDTVVPEGRPLRRGDVGVSRSAPSDANARRSACAPARCRTCRGTGCRSGPARP